MQHLEVSGAVRHIYMTLGGKGLRHANGLKSWVGGYVLLPDYRRANSKTHYIGSEPSSDGFSLQMCSEERRRSVADVV
jgi:hypothetical protein